MLYLDNAATTVRKPFSVYAALFSGTLFEGGNAGRGAYKKSAAAVNAIIDTQDAIARLFNISKPENIIFTPNATYALNTAISGIAGKGGHVVVTAMEHNSVLRPVYRLGNYTVVRADGMGRVNPKDVENALKEDTCLIVCTHASNVCGTVLPVCEIGAIAKKHGIPFLVDAAQTAGCLDIDVGKMNADMIAFPGHKGLLGPLGTGGLYISNPEKLEPLTAGGTGSNSESMVQPDIMPDKFHSGTMNTPAIKALGQGVRYILKRGVKNISDHEQSCAKKLRANLKNMKNITVYGDGKGVATVAFNVKGMDSEEFAARIGKYAAVRAGYHCAPLAHRSLGTLETGAVRISLGIFNSLRDVRRITDYIYGISREI